MAKQGAVRGGLFIVSAPSGAGKTSLVHGLIARMPGVAVSVSHTTRAMRPGEQNGVHYHFVTKDAFVAMVQAGAFLEHAQVFDNYYGTAETSVLTLLEQGSDVILEIDWQGARQVRKRFPEAIGICVLPPSKAALLERLTGRGQDSADIIARRMRDAVTEMSHYPEFDYLLVNDDFEAALDALRAVILAQRQRLSVQSERHEGLLQELLA